MIKIDLEFRLIMILLAILLVFGLSFYYSDFSAFITFFFFLFLGQLFFLGCGFCRRIQLISFLVNITAAVVIVSSFQALYGTWYSEGKDDFAFYSLSKDLVDSTKNLAIKDVDIEWHSVQYKLYIWVFSKWFTFLNFLGIKANFFFHLNILNSFVASFIAPFIYKLGRLIFNGEEKTPKRTAYFLAFFPPLVYYSAILSRDTWIVTMFLIVVFIALAKYDRYKKVILIPILLVITYYIRDSAAVFAIMFLGLYMAVKSKNTYISYFMDKIAPIAAIGVIIMVFLSLQLPKSEVAPSKLDILNYINYIVNFYRDLSLAESTDASLGIRLRMSNNPVLLVFYYIYIYIGPIPPKLVKDFNLINIFLAVGNIIWYIIAPLFFIHVYQLRKTGKRVFLKAFFWFLAVVLVIVGSTTGGQRHILFLYPLISLFSIDYILNHRKQFFNYMKVLFLLIILGIGFYSILKMLL